MSSASQAVQTTIEPRDGCKHTEARRAACSAALTSAGVNARHSPNRSPRRGLTQLITLPVPARRKRHRGWVKTRESEDAPRGVVRTAETGGRVGLRLAPRRRNTKYVNRTTTAPSANCKQSQPKTFIPSHGTAALAQWSGKLERVVWTIPSKIQHQNFCHCVSVQACFQTAWIELKRKERSLGLRTWAAASRLQLLLSDDAMDVPDLCAGLWRCGLLRC